MIPAANAPSTTSRSNTAATAISATSSRNTTRTGSWKVPPFISVSDSPRNGMRRIRRAGTNAVTTAASPNRISTTTAAPMLRLVNSSDIARIGPNSPTAPFAITARPSGRFSKPSCLMIGSRVPSAVEVIAMATPRPS
ncbi:Uncharacterised protein [Gordonia bronchialis]|nr:Uncharacterised protein [Gordonia bronchialis]